MEPPKFPSEETPAIQTQVGASAVLHLSEPTGTKPFLYKWSRGGTSLEERFTSAVEQGVVRLTVTSAQADDAGVYTLEASNEAGTDTARVRLEVEDPPTFLRRLQDLTVKVGSRTRFLVEIASSTECQVTWYRNERRLLEAERVTLAHEGNFWCAEVAPVSVEDAGRWTCTAENVAGRTSCSGHLNVLVPKAYKRPEFVEELRALLTEQGTVSLECKVVGVPTPVLRWFKDSKEIKAGDVFALTANAEDPTSLGTYTCEAVNCMGRAYSSSKVHVVGRTSREGSMPSALTQEPPPIFTREMEDQSVKICGQLRLSCRALVPPWPRSVVWYNKEGKVESGERYQMIEDGAGGYMIEIASSEWCDEGEWKCVATSAGGRVSVSTCHVVMDVPHNYRAPRFMESLSAVLTEEGLVSFECKVVGFPTPLLRWFKDGHELKPGDVYHLTGTNSLGSYCCIARNCMGQASSSAELTVEDIQSQLNEEEKLQLFSKNQAPKFILGLKSVEAKIDEPFRFNVKVNTPPEPSVSWYRDEQPVDDSNRCHLGQEDKGIFFIDIQNLEFMDQAEWKCVAMNDYGHSVTSCFLKLMIPRHYKKPRFLENLQAILSDEGAVNLECKVIGVPQPILKWYKDGEELKPGDIHRIISGQDGTCCLGTYTCEAQNCMGIASSSASLLGYDDPTKVKAKKITTQQSLERNLSLSTIHEERTSQMYDTPVGDITLDDKGEVSFSFDGKEVSVSLYETPDLTEEEALQIVEMYADQLSENVTEHNVVELPPLRFVKETSTSGNLLMEAIIIDVSPEYFVSPEEDLRTEADVDDISNADDIGPQLSLDQDISGENYIEKTMALISEEKSDIPKIMRRKKSESQKSGEDFFSLSRDPSLSDGKDDDTHVLSASDLESFASAKSSAKNISKPSTKEGAESSENLHKTVIQENIEVIHEEFLKTPTPEKDSEKDGTQNDAIVIDNEDINMNVIHIDQHFATKMISIGNSLDEIINKAQIVEKDIISKCELMSSAIAASKSLEVINGLISPLIEIQSTANTIGNPLTQNIGTMSSCLKHFVKSLKTLQQASTMIEKCIEIKSESKTLVQKTCGKLVETIGDDLQNVVQELKNTLRNYKLFVDEKTKSEIDILTNEIKTALILSSDTIKTQNLLIEAGEITQVNEPSAEMKHVRETQKVIFLFKNTLNSLLCIVENAEKCNSKNELKIRKIDVVLNDMSGTVFELQTVLERIESLSVKESCGSFTKYNTEIIETVMESVLKLRSSFEELSEKPSEDSESLKVAFASIKNILCEIYANVNAIEHKVGSFDILQSENKLDVLQKIAQSLIALESNLLNLDSIPEIKSHFCTFHKKLTKVLEKVLENNNSKQYFALVEICDTVNRVNNNIKLIESENILAFASLCNSIETIRGHFDKTIFDNELNDSVKNNIKDILICLEQALNIAEEVSIKIDSEHAAEKNIDVLDFTKAKLLIEHIECTIATIGNISVLDTTQELKGVLTPALENIIPSLEELKKNIALVQNINVNRDESLSDLSELSFSEAIANPLCELNQNIVILNQNIFEHIYEIKNQSDMSYKFAETLHELHTILEIMQQYVISQYDEDVIPYEVSVNVASAIQNLQSCIVMVEENAGAEAIDDMSTLEDISGIKTSAEMISEEHIMAVPAAFGTLTNYFTSSLEQESIPFTSAEALYNLNEHITVLKNPEIMDALDTLSDITDLTSLKTVNTNLQELCMAIEEILHPITLESTTHLSNIGSISKLLSIAQPMQELSKSLSVFDTKDVPIYEEILEMSSEKVYSLLQDVNSFRDKLRQCIETVISPLETVNMSVEVSNKVKNVRDMCCQLTYILKSTTCLSENVPMQCDSIAKLENIVDELLQATDTTHEFSMKEIKNITEELYRLTMSVQDSVIHFVPQSADKLAQEVKLVQCVDELEKSIAVLEQYEFIDLSKASELSFNTTTQFVIELQTEPLHDIEGVVENIVHILQDKIQESIEDTVDDLVFIEEFFKNCKNEFVIIRCLISRSLTHKTLLRVLQEVINLENLIENFKSTHSSSKISNEFNICLNIFFTHSTECLQKMKESITNIVVSQSGVLFKIPLQKINKTVALIENEVPKEPKMLEIANNFNVLLKSVYNYLENLESCVLSELKTSSPIYSNSDEIVEKLMEFVYYADNTRSVSSINEKSNLMLTELLLSIQMYKDFENASPTGVRLILLKCLSECCDIINKYLVQTKPNEVNELSEEDLSRTSLKPILKEALAHLKAFNNQLNIIQECILSGVDQDSISIDMSSTESMVQSVTEACKEVTILENDLVSEINVDLNKQEYYLIQEVDNEIHSIQENMKIIHNVPVMHDVQIVSEPLDTMDIKLQSILSFEPIEQEPDSNTGLLNKAVKSGITELHTLSIIESESTEKTIDFHQQKQSVNIAISQSKDSVPDTKQESFIESLQKNNLIPEKAICQLSSSELESEGEAMDLHKQVVNVGINQHEDQMPQLETEILDTSIPEDFIAKEGSVKTTTQEKGVIAVCQVSSSEFESAKEATDPREQKQDLNVALSQIEQELPQFKNEIVEMSKAQDVSAEEGSVIVAIQEKSLIAKQAVYQVSSSELKSTDKANDLQNKDQMSQLETEVLEESIPRDVSAEEGSIVAEEAVCQVLSKELESTEVEIDLSGRKQDVNVAISQHEDQVPQLKIEVACMAQDVSEIEEKGFKESSVIVKQTICEVSSSELESAQESTDLREQKQVVNVSLSHIEEQMSQIQNNIVELSVVQDVLDIKQESSKMTQEKSLIADQAVCQVSSSELESIDEAIDLPQQKPVVNVAISQNEDQMQQFETEVIEASIAQDLSAGVGGVETTTQENILITEQTVCQVSSSELESANEATDLREEKHVIDVALSQHQNQMPQLEIEVVEALIAQDILEIQVKSVKEPTQEKSLTAQQDICKGSSSDLENIEESTDLLQQNEIVNIALSQIQEPMSQLHTEIVEVSVEQDVSEIKQESYKVAQEKNLMADQAIFEVSSSELESAEESTDLHEQKQVVNVPISQHEEQMAQMQTNIVKTLIAQDVSETQVVSAEETTQDKSVICEQAVCQVLSSKLEKTEQETDLREEKLVEESKEKHVPQIKTEIVQASVAQYLLEGQQDSSKEVTQEKSAVCPASNNELKNVEEATDLLEQKQVLNVALSQIKEQMPQLKSEIVEVSLAQAVPAEEKRVKETTQERNLMADQTVCQVSSSELENAENAGVLYDQKQVINAVISQQEEQMLQMQTHIVETLIAQDVSDTKGVNVEESAEQAVCQVSSSELESTEGVSDLREEKQFINVAISQYEDEIAQLETEGVEVSIALDVSAEERNSKATAHEKILIAEQAVCQVSSSELESLEESTNLIGQKQVVKVSISQHEDPMIQLETEVVEAKTTQDVSAEEEIVKATTQENSLIAEQVVSQVSISEVDSAEEATDLPNQKQVVNVAITQHEDQMIQLETEVVEANITQHESAEEKTVKAAIQGKSFIAKQAVSQVSISELESSDEATDLREQKPIVNVAISQNEDQMIQLETKVVEAKTTQDVSPEEEIVKVTSQEQSLVAKQAVSQVSSSELKSAEEATDLREQKQVVNVAIIQQDDQMIQLETKVFETKTAQDVSTEEKIVKETIQEKTLVAERAVSQVSSSELESVAEATDLREQKQVVNVAMSQYDDQMIQLETTVVEAKTAEDFSAKEEIVKETIQENTLVAEQAVSQVSSSELESAEEATDLREQKQVVNVAICQHEDQMIQLETRIVEAKKAQDLSAEEKIVKATSQEQSLAAEQAVSQVSSSELESAAEATDLREQKQVVNVAICQHEDQMIQLETKVFETKTAQDVSAEEKIVKETIQEKTLVAERAVSQVSSSELESVAEATDLREQKQVVNVAMSQYDDQMIQLETTVVEAKTAQDVAAKEEIVKETIQENTLVAEQAVSQVSSSELESAEEATDLREQKQVVNVAICQHEDQMIQLETRIVEAKKAQDLSAEEEIVKATSQEQSLVAEQAASQVSSSELKSAEEATDLREQKQVVNVAICQHEDQMIQLETKVFETKTAQDVSAEEKIVKETIQEKTLVAERAVSQVSSSELESAAEATDLREQKQVVNVAICQHQDQMIQLETRIVEATKAQDFSAKEEIVKETIQENTLVAEQAVSQVSSSELESAEEATDLREQKQDVNVAICQHEDQLIQLETRIVEAKKAQDLSAEEEIVKATSQEQSLVAEQAASQVSSSELKSAEEATDLREQKQVENVAMSQCDDQMIQLETKVVEAKTAQDVSAKEEIVKETIQENTLDAEQAVSQVSSSELDSAEEATDLCEQTQVVNVAISQHEDEIIQLETKVFEAKMPQDVSVEAEIVKETTQEKTLIAKQAVSQVSSSKLDSAEEATDLREQKQVVNVAISQHEDEIIQLETKILEAKIPQDVSVEATIVKATAQEKNLFAEQAVCQVSSSGLKSSDEVADLCEQKQVVNVAISQTEEQMPQIKTEIVQTLVAHDVIDFEQKSSGDATQEDSVITDPVVCQVSSSELESIGKATSLSEQKLGINVAISQYEDDMSQLRTKIVEASIAQNVPAEEGSVKATTQEKSLIAEQAVCQVSNSELESAEQATDLREQKQVINVDIIQTEEQIPQIKTEILQASVAQDVLEIHQKSSKDATQQKSVIVDQVVCQVSSSELESVAKTTDLPEQKQDVNVAISQSEDQISDKMIVSKDNIVHESTSTLQENLHDSLSEEPIIKFQDIDEHEFKKHDKERKAASKIEEEQCKPENAIKLQSTSDDDIKRLITDFKQFATNEFSEEVTTLSSVMNVDALTESITIVKDLLLNIASSSIQNTPSMECATYDMMEKLSFKQYNVIKDIQSALTVIQCDPMENTEKLVINTAAKHIVKLATQLQQDLSNAMQSPSVVVLEKLSDLLQECNQVIPTQDRLLYLLKEVNDGIKESQNKEKILDPESLRDVMDEVQTVIIKIKRDIDKVPNHAINETLDDLECSVRSVQLQNNEQSKVELVKEVSDGLKTLLNNIEADSNVHEIINKSPETLDNIVANCDQSILQTLALIEVSSKSDINSFTTIMLNLKDIKENIQNLRILFISNSEEIINKGIEVLLKLEQTEDKIQILQKNLLSENKLKPETGKCIMNAVNSVTKSIENMRSTLLSIQKQYLYENYGKPLDNFLQSLRSISLICKLEDENNICPWKSLATSIRKTLGHFEDIKFYVNLDKSARILSKTAVTEHILNELKTSLINIKLCSELTENKTISKSMNEAVNMLNEQILTMKSSPTIAVNEKIPLFTNCSAKFYKFTENVKIALQGLKDTSDMMKDELVQYAVDLPENYDVNLPKNNESLSEVVTDSLLENTSSGDIKQKVQEGIQSEYNDKIKNQEVNKTQQNKKNKSRSEQQVECIPCDAVNEESFDLNKINKLGVVNAEQGIHLLNECHVEHKIIYEKENEGNVANLLTEHVVEGTSIIDEKDHFEKAHIYAPSLVDAPALTTKKNHDVKQKDSELITPETSLSNVKETNDNVVDVTKSKTSTTSQKNIKLDTVNENSECNNNIEIGNRNEKITLYPSTSLQIDVNVGTEGGHKIDSDINSDNGQNKVQIKVLNESKPAVNVELPTTSQEEKKTPKIVDKNVSNLNEVSDKNITQSMKDHKQMSSVSIDVQSQPLEENYDIINQSATIIPGEVTESRESAIQSDKLNRTESMAKEVSLKDILVTDDIKKTNLNIQIAEDKKKIQSDVKQDEEREISKHIENKNDTNQLSKKTKVGKKITLDKNKPHDSKEIKKTKQELIKKSKDIESEDVRNNEIVNRVPPIDTSLAEDNSEKNKTQHIAQNRNEDLSKTDLYTSTDVDKNKLLQNIDSQLSPVQNLRRNVDNDFGNTNDFAKSKDTNLREDNSELNYKSEISRVEESRVKQRNLYSGYDKGNSEDKRYNKDIPVSKPKPIHLGDIDSKYSDSLSQCKDRKSYSRYTLEQCADTNKVDFDRPPSYNQRNSGLDFTESFHIPNNHMYGRCDPVYKAKSLVPESRLRSKTPGTTPSSDDISERQRLRIRKTASPRAFSVEKSSSVPRDLKRKPVFSTYLTDRTAVEGSRVKLTCSVLSSTDPKVTWYRNGNLLDNKLKYRTKFSDGLITLEVLNAVPTDSAEYSCVVENDNGAVSCNANLKVYPCFESSPIPPTFTRSIRDTYHMAENELVLECRIRGQPLPIITWLKDDVPISSNERYQAYYLADGVCRLCINAPTSDDSGKYTCRAENSVWSDQITHVVNFTGKESRLDLNLTTTERTKFARQALESRRPHFSNVLTDHAVCRGGTIGLQVEIRGAPTRVEWLREGTYINESYRNARTFVEQELYTLALSDVTEKESGLYTCRAWSSHGNVDMNASVTVVQPSDVKDGKPAILVSRPEKDVLISVGEDLNVSFRVQGEPKPKVIWMKGTRDITNNDRVCKMTSDDYMKFTLKRSVVSDAGTYCVLARNAYGCDRAFVTVVVRQRASSENLIRDWTYPSDDSHLAHSDRVHKPLPGRIPGEPTAIDGGDNWLSLCWPKPDVAVAPVLAYKMEIWRVGAEGGARWSELGITPLNSYDVFNLKRGDQYHFRVTPRNRYGWGETVQTTHPIGVGHSGDRPEFVELLPGQLKVMLGERATLRCRVQANPLPDILWTKNGHEVEESDKRISLAYDGHNCRLTIDKVTMDDEGRYSCEATNGFGRTSTYARLAVVTDKMVWEADAKLKRERSAECDGEYPPQFTLRLRDRRVQASYPVRLTCQVIGSPAPEVTWFKNGVKIYRDDRHSMFQDEHFHTLEIAPTTLEDGGVYEAMARNTRAALSCRCSLVVDKGIRAYVAPEFCCGLQPLYRYLEGEELRVSAVVEAYPSVGVSWYRDGIRLRPSRRTIMTLDRDGAVELALASVTPRDAGVYSCTASNEVGTATTSGRVDVIEGVRRKDIPEIEQPMMYPPDVPYSKEPMFVRKPRSSEAHEGDTVIIECEVVGDPKPDVFWLRDFLKPDYYRDATHFRRVGSGPEYRLEIPHAKFDHTGAYSVLAKNVHGEAKAVISLQILAKDPDSTDTHNVSYGRVETLPRFVKELCDVVCCDGDVVQFQCEVSGTPFPDIKWVKYNQIIHENDDFELTCDESEVILRIKRVTAEDEGVYVCEASNVLGRTTSNACLIVYPPGEPNMLSQQLRRPPAFQSAQSTPRSTPRATPARSRSLSRTPVPETRRLYSPSRRVAPKFYTYPHNKVVEEGNYATFRCAVTGHPSPWTSWDKDGVPVTPSARITVKEKEDTRLLEIEEVTIEDAGLYRIVLENDHGRSEASARLDVITRRGKYYGGVRSYSVSPRRATSSGRRLASVSRHTPVPDSSYDRRDMLDDRLRVIDHESDTHCDKPKENQS